MESRKVKFRIVATSVTDGARSTVSRLGGGEYFLSLLPNLTSVELSFVEAQRLLDYFRHEPQDATIWSADLGKRVPLSLVTLKLETVP